METKMPQRIFQYEIHDYIGNGKNGEVYRGLDSTSGRQVVVKLLRPEIGADTAFKTDNRKRLDCARNREHPNIATLLEIIEHDNRIVLVSEFVAGRSFQAVLESGPMQVANFTPWVCQIAAGLKFLHDAEIIHGNIKPSNIIVSDNGTVKLTDFCLPRIPESNETDLVTYKRELIEFASPEEVCCGPLQPASDLFSLGSVLYKMLTGQPPFPGQNAAEVSRQILNFKPDFGLLTRQQVPGEIKLLLKRLLSAQPKEQRCTDCEELIATLEAISHLEKQSIENEIGGYSPSYRLYLLLPVLVVLLVLLWSYLAGK